MKIKNSELQDLNTAKDKFISVIAHDLKTPAANIESLSTIIKDCYDNPNEKEDVKTCIDMLLESAKAHNKLLANLLDMSKIQLGSTQYNPEQLDMRKLVNEVLEQTKLQAHQKHISQINQVDEYFTMADKNMITTVIRNIVVNAIKFTNAGGKVVISSEKKNTELVISIADTGVGISDSKKSSIFNADYNKSTIGTANESGTGLGLLLCKEYVERNKGRIWFESEVGKGTTFFFTLPTLT
jgi:signal transduction histidine kinase